jgi:acetylornithine deacetylase/succinyl-diaminopimelate desuccinylase-like protein
VRALSEALRRHGTEPRVHDRAPWWAPYHVLGAPFASGGPGSAGGAHGPDEWASVDGLRNLMHVSYDALALIGA